MPFLAHLITASTKTCAAFLQHQSPRYDYLIGEGRGYLLALQRLT